MNVASLVAGKPNPNIPALASGDTVKVHTKIIEGDKARTQVFQGTVIKLRRGQDGLSFTVRHVAYGVGVERTFPSASPLVEKVEVVRHGKVRRAKLYYLRGLSGKASRIKEKRVERGEEVEVAAEPIAQAEAEAPAQPEAAATAPAEAKPTQPAPEAKKATAPEAKPAAQPQASAPKQEEPPKA